VCKKGKKYDNQGCNTRGLKDGKQVCQACVSPHALIKIKKIKDNNFNDYYKGNKTLEYN
jgi:hypothetical protein